MCFWSQCCALRASRAALPGDPTPFGPGVPPFRNRGLVMQEMWKNVLKCSQGHKWLQKNWYRANFEVWPFYPLSLRCVKVDVTHKLSINKRTNTEFLKNIHFWRFRRHKRVGRQKRPNIYFLKVYAYSGSGQNFVSNPYETAVSDFVAPCWVPWISF